jgi:hypothetical protein
MSISGKMSIGIRRAAPTPMMQISIREAMIVYGRFSANSANDISESCVSDGSGLSRARSAIVSIMSAHASHPRW